MIINTGMRTDIPAFYSKWLMNRIREGYVLVRNPYNPLNVTKYSLSKGYTHDCTISFLDLYEKVKRNAPDIKPPTKDEQIQIAKAFSKIGKENDMVIHSCCEKTYLAEYGLDISGCMSKKVVEKAIGYSLNQPKVKNLREDCNCLMGNDIGAYNTCGHLCKYCYANYNKELVLENMRKHYENSPFLIGEASKEDKIIEAKQKSWKIVNEQISFL